MSSLPSPAVPPTHLTPHHSHTHESTRQGGFLPPCHIEKHELTRPGGFLPPCRVEKRKSTLQGGDIPPCSVDLSGTRGPNPHGFRYPRDPQYPYPNPSKPIPMSTGTGEITHELPVTCPIQNTRHFIAPNFEWRGGFVPPSRPRHSCHVSFTGQ